MDILGGDKVITDSFIFVHMPRTAGSTIQLIIRDSGAEIINAANHMSLAQSQGLVDRDPPAFTVIRNPYEWYVSWYRRLVQTDRCDFDFRGFLLECLDKPETDLPVPYYIYGSMSQCWSHFVGSPPNLNLQVIRYERLELDLPTVLHDLSRGDIEPEYTIDQLHRIRERPTGKYTFTDYYDKPELIDLVRRSDHQLLRHYGYMFQSEVA